MCVHTTIFFRCLAKQEHSLMRAHVVGGFSCIGHSLSHTHSLSCIVAFMQQSFFATGVNDDDDERVT